MFPVVPAFFKATFVAAAAALARPFTESLVLTPATALACQLIIIWISARRIVPELSLIGFRAGVALMFLIPHSVVCHNFPSKCSEIVRS
jgi:hypothetical protein